MIRITVLQENIAARSDVIAEHGLSLYIETPKHTILFDMGQTEAFAENARVLGVDLSRVDVAILSHAHYDHTGGLARFLAENDHAPVYASRHVFAPCYSGDERYIGMDPALFSSDRLILTGDTLEIDEELTLQSCNGLPFSFPMSGKGLTTLQDGAYIQDTFLHEQYLTIRDGARRIVISGCSHKGVLNIAQWLSPDVLIGGFHYKGFDPAGEDSAFLKSAALQLLEHSTLYYTCHCTGEAPYAFMKEIMGDRLHYAACGDRFTL